ncbi:MAG: putative glycoside hydrolase [Leptospirales bacterium]|nr:putative glycoside hydrolase [Leptospirales bacterium]
MKKLFIALLLSATLVATVGYISVNSAAVHKKSNKNTELSNDPNPQKAYEFPDYYRGIYLTVPSARDIEKLKVFVEQAKAADINVFVIDTQNLKLEERIIPEENIAYCIENGIHPVARVVLFPDGLSYFPVEESLIEERLTTAENACINGFREIQFDYIRFNDSNQLKNLTLEDRYKFIGEILVKARARLEKYDARIAVDIFGRVPLNQNDIIGQKMEHLDELVDIICPMAYPSHYTWSKKMLDDPYYTVYTTSVKAAERVKNAKIVTYIQAFRMRLGSSTYEHYLREQIRAVHDSGVKGYIMWNARQDYELPFKIAKEYYRNNSKTAAKKPEDSKEKSI